MKDIPFYFQRDFDFAGEISTSLEGERYNYNDWLVQLFISNTMYDLIIMHNIII